MSTSTNPEDLIFYTYILLDPRIVGTFIYDDGKLIFEKLPIYAGKGSYDRINDHVRDAKNSDKESDKLNLIREILEAGYEPTIMMVSENITEKEAHNIERYAIRVVGRADKGLGPLTNKTDGGEGFSGRIWTEEERKLHSERLTGIKKPPRTDEHRENLGHAIAEVWIRKLEEGFQWSDETINKRAEANRGQTRTDEQKQRMSEAHMGIVPWNKGIPVGEQVRQEMSVRSLAFYDTEDGRKVKEYLSAINTGENNPNYGTKNSEETKEKRKATRKKNGYWQKDKEEISEAFSNGARKRFSDPEERQKASERVKGKRWYNNGKQHGQYWTDKQPEGWVLGMLLEGKKWYNNGIKTSQFHPDKRPEGWVLGRLKFKTKQN